MAFNDMIPTELLVFIIASLFYVSHGCDEITDWPYKTFLDSNNKIFAKWMHDKENITIQVIGETKGWIGIGFSPNSGMSGADIILGWVQNGKGNIQDRHGLPNENGFPPLDKKQDIELLSSSENDTHTTLCFRRKLNTCDEEDLPITNGTMKIIWAMNSNDPNDPSDPEYHGPKNRGQLSQYMLGEVYKKPSMDDIKTWDIKVDKVAVPGNETTYYWCQIFRAPNVTEKQHLIGFEPMIQKENVDIVHHFTIYECTGENIEEQINNITDLNQGFPCFAEVSPPASFQCQKGFVTWAIGLKGQFYPPNVGYPFAYYNNKHVYYMIDAHYNNADLRKEISDSSGLRFYYTSKLRKYDASQFVLAYFLHQPFQILPPGQETWKSLVICPTECLKKTFTEDKIYIFGAYVHAHTRGTRIVLRHIRGKKELRPIIENNHYDFNYQETILFPSVEVLSTDLLGVECFYNTTKEKKNVLGGKSTSDEMCMVFVLYYPRINLSRCYSNIPIEDIENITGVEKLKPLETPYDERVIQYPQSLQNLTLRSYLQNLTLSTSQISMLRNVELKGQKYVTCLTDDGPKQLNESFANYPENLQSYIKEDVCKKK